MIDVLYGIFSPLFVTRWPFVGRGGGRTNPYRSFDLQIKSDEHSNRESRAFNDSLTHFSGFLHKEKEKKCRSGGFLFLSFFAPATLGTVPVDPNMAKPILVDTDTLIRL